MSSSEESEDDNWGLPAPSSGPKMERCLLGKSELLLPEAMLEQVNIHILKPCVLAAPTQFQSWDTFD